jgi:phosphoribosylamine--glycine ligase
MSKKVLLVDGGARGHALAWKLAKSPQLSKLYVAPGNAGTIQVAENVALKATDVDGLLAFALKEGIDLIVVGQDDPLAMGIVDAFQANGLRVFGPTQGAATIESSKVFSKSLMVEAGVPTAKHNVFSDIREASEFLKTQEYPLLVKADGLALGKGAYVCANLMEANLALNECMEKRLHGEAGNKIVIEEFVDGQEVSIHAFCDGGSFKIFPSAQDHKPIFDGDRGPNTGGMGTIAPVPWFTLSNSGEAQEIVGKTLLAMHDRGTPFVGLLYPGLKMSSKGPRVLEFNARFGDPETQVYMRLLKTDIIEIFEACIDGRLHEIDVEWEQGFAACIVMASEGYPSPNYKKGVPIDGIFEAENLPGVIVFHAGTKFGEGGRLVTSGGRVLGVTALGTTLQEALDRAYAGVTRIHFEGMQYRKDIGAKSLAVC